MPSEHLEWLRERDPLDVEIRLAHYVVVDYRNNERGKSALAQLKGRQDVLTAHPVKVMRPSLVPSYDQLGIPTANGIHALNIAPQGKWQWGLHGGNIGLNVFAA